MLSLSLHLFHLQRRAPHIIFAPTPAGRTIDYSVCEEQPGDEPPTPFSFLNMVQVRPFFFFFSFFLFLFFSVLALSPLCGPAYGPRKESFGTSTLVLASRHRDANKGLGCALMRRHCTWRHERRRSRYCGPQHGPDKGAVKELRS